jgi:hypothetical protein
MRKEPHLEAAPPVPERTRSSGSLVMSLAFLLPGLLLLWVAEAFYSQSSRLVHHGLRAQGTVVDTVIGTTRKNGHVWYPIVRYTAQDGGSYRFQSSSGSNPPAYNVGDTVEVLYWPADPEHGTINGFFSLWGGPLIAGVLGGVFTSIGGLLLYLLVLLPYRRARGRR